MSIFKHSNKYLLALFISHVFFVIIIQAAPREETSKPGSIPHLTAALSNIHPHEWQQVSNYGIELNVSSDNELEEMYESHRKNRANNRLQRAVIVGGGVNGLLAAFELFLSGIQVVLVNDRKEEEYIRNYIVGVGSNYGLMLETCLGTAFKELLRNKITEKGLINLKLLENVLKERLKSLARYVNDKEEERDKEEGKEEKKRKKEKDSLKLIYEYSVDKIQFPTTDNPEYSAVLKSINSPITTSLPFDLLVCAGGTKDKIRDTYLGIPNQLTKPEKFGVAVFLKADKYKNERLKCGTTKKETPTEDMHIKFLRENNLIKYICDSQSLLNKEEEDICYEIISKKKHVMFQETGHIFSVYHTITPLLSRHFDDIDKAKRENKEKVKEFDDIKLEILKRVLAALVYQKINTVRDQPDWVEINMKKNPKKGMLNFDPYPVNTTTFDFVQHALDNVAVQYTVLGRSAIVLAVGDSTLNSHIYSGASLCFGQVGIHEAVDRIKKYNASPPNIEASQLVNEFNTIFDILKKELLDATKDYIKDRKRSPEDIKRRAQRRIQLAVKKMIVQNNTQANYGFGMSAESQDDLNKFKIVFITTGGEKEYPASLTDEGHIQVGDKKFATVVQAAMWLKEQKPNVL